MRGPASSSAASQPFLFWTVPALRSKAERLKRLDVRRRLKLLETPPFIAPDFLTVEEPSTSLSLLYFLAKGILKVICSTSGVAFFFFFKWWCSFSCSRNSLIRTRTLKTISCLPALRARAPSPFQPQEWWWLWGRQLLGAPGASHWSQWPNFRGFEWSRLAPTRSLRWVNTRVGRASTFFASGCLTGRPCWRAGLRR